MFRIIVTAESKDLYDFVSRSFASQKGIPEGPVTGTAHCMLAILGETPGQVAFKAYQALRRGGEAACRVLGERVELQRTCMFYLEGEVSTPMPPPMPSLRTS